MLTIFSSIIGILGLVASLTGAYFTYISFINPIKRFKKYLQKPDNWKKISVVEDHLTVYRHKKYPDFQIIIDWDRPKARNYHEEWIRDYPDSEHNTSYFVRLEVKGMFLEKELFLSLDGGRVFVPVPRRELKNNQLIYWYDKFQIQLARIIGEYELDKDIEEFVHQQKKIIEIRE